MRRTGRALYERCVKDKQGALLSGRSCENAMAETGQYPCSDLCPCNLRDQFIALYESAEQMVSGGGRNTQRAKLLDEIAEFDTEHDLI